MSGAVFLYSHRVTYADCTLGNHVYHSRYLDLLEAARGEFFRHLGTTFLQWQEQGVILPVVECHLRYLSPARYDDLLSVEVWVRTAQRVRMNFAYRIRSQAGELVLEGETHHVCTGLEGRPKRLPEDLLARTRPYWKDSVAAAPRNS